MGTPSSVPGPDQGAASDAVRRTPGRRPNGGEPFGAALSAEIGSRSAPDDRAQAMRDQAARRGVHEETARHRAAQDRTAQHRAAQDRIGRHRAVEDRAAHERAAGSQDAGVSEMNGNHTKPARRRMAVEDETATGAAAAAAVNQSGTGVGIMAGAQATAGPGDSAAMGEAGSAGTTGQIVTPAGQALSSGGSAAQADSATAAPTPQDSATAHGPAGSVDHGVTPAEADKTSSKAHDRGSGPAPSQPGNAAEFTGAVQTQTGDPAAAPGQPEGTVAAQTKAAQTETENGQDPALNPAAAQGRPGDLGAPADPARDGRSIAAAGATQSEANGTPPAVADAPRSTPDGSASGSADTAAPDAAEPAKGAEDRPAAPAATADPPPRDAAPGVPDHALTGATGPAPAALATAPATPPPAQGNAPPAAPPAAQIAMRIVPLRLDADGVHRLTVHLHPADLGPVQVVAEIRNGDVTLQLSGSTDAGTAALRDSLDDLRRELTESGFGNCSLDLQDGGGEQARPQYERGHQSLSSIPSTTAAPTAAPAPAPQKAGRLDVRA